MNDIQEFCSSCNKYAMKDDMGNWMIFSSKPVFVTDIASWVGEYEGTIPHTFFKTIYQEKTSIKPEL